MNVKALAKLAGVSPSTVSKAFSGSPEISDATRERIFAIAREQGCFDRYNKNKFHKKVVAVIVPETDSDYYNNALSHIRTALEARGALMTVSVNGFSRERLQELYTYYGAYCHVDGILLLDGFADLQDTVQVPTVAVGSVNRSTSLTRVNVSLQTGIDQAFAYLKEHGHVEVGYAGEALTSGKLELCKATMRRMGLPVREQWIKVSNRRFEEAGEDAVEALLAAGQGMPTAIVAAYDYIALGVMRALRAHGYRVPQDVSVIGMDDIHVSSYPETSLATVQSNLGEACGKATEILFKKMENKHYAPRELTVVDTQFIPRASCGRAKE